MLNEKEDVFVKTNNGSTNWKLVITILSIIASIIPVGVIVMIPFESKMDIISSKLYWYAVKTTVYIIATAIFVGVFLSLRKEEERRKAAGEEKPKGQAFGIIVLIVTGITVACNAIGRSGALISDVITRKQVETTIADTYIAQETTGKRIKTTHYYITGKVDGTNKDIKIEVPKEIADEVRRESYSHDKKVMVTHLNCTKIFLSKRFE